jgi:hypothetical protein
VGAAGRCAAIYPLHRTLGRRSAATHTFFAISDNWISPVLTIALFIFAGSDNLKFRRAMALRSEHRRFSYRPDYLSRFLDLAVGTHWPRFIYPLDRMSRSHGATRAAARIF